MRLQLTGYQIDAATDLAVAIREGFTRFSSNQKLSAIGLAAPTGAGKTVIATAVIEKILYGDEFTEPDPGLTVLWVTDDPNLNEQTRRKMQSSSSLIKPAQLVSVDPSLDLKEFDSGKIYFIHIQQLGKGATNYVRVGNSRQFSLWETIGNTIKNRPSQFLLVVDEAHRGTSSKNKSIVSQLMDGAGGQFPPAPVVLGISATPERFNEAMAKAGQRVLEPVVVPIDEVRESGLLKDKIRIRHPREQQPGDSTLLEMAVGELRQFDKSWEDYSRDQDEPLVEPVLVIQVRAKVAELELREIVDTLSSAWSKLEGKALAHSFQEHATLNLGTRAIRYIAPQDIQDDPYVRVVLFKEALTTGWDCPRAEVMLSFRVAQDHTYIAQLIGRMVRTPLARRIPTDDALNTVSLFLPHYDDAQVTAVIEGLTSDDSNVTATIEVDSVVCQRNAEVPEAVWKALDEVPTYTRPGKHHRNEVARMNSLATLLVGNELESDALNTAQDQVVAVLGAQARRLGKDLVLRVKDLERLDYQTQTYDFRTEDTQVELASVLINARNIDDLFRAARRRLGDSAAKWYWDSLMDDSSNEMDGDSAKIFVSALSEDPQVVAALESTCTNLIDGWRLKYSRPISKLKDAQRQKFYQIWLQAKKPEQVALIMPSQVTASEKGSRHRLHLYADSSGSFPVDLSGWEEEVLRTEFANDSLVAWYRNPTGGQNALAVPYEQSGIFRTMYPDFLFFHVTNNETVVDVIDPHRPDSADTSPKWEGLARFASLHGSRFRRILAVIKNDESEDFLALDMKNPALIDRFASSSNETDVRRIFADFGGLY